MPTYSKAKKKLDKDFFHEIAEKCAYLGVSLSEKEFLKHQDTYLALADSYDKQVSDYTFQHKDKLLSLQKHFAQTENLPDFLALGKARQTLCAELQHSLLAKQMAQSAFDIIQHNFNFSLKELNNPTYSKRFHLLAQTLGVHESTLKQQLDDTLNISSALLNSSYKNNLIKLAAFDDKVKSAAVAMAQFAHTDTDELFENVVNSSEVKSQFSLIVTQNSAKQTNLTPNQKKQSDDKSKNSSPVERILNEFAKYHDNQNGKPLLSQNAKALKKKANFVYLDKIIKEFNLNEKDASQFRIQLSQFNGSLQNFLEQYKNAETPQTRQNDISATQSETSPAISQKNIDEQKKKEALARKAKKETLKKQKAEQKLLKLEQKKKETLARKAKKETLKKQKAEQKLLKLEQKRKETLARKAKKEALKKQKVEQKLLKLEQKKKEALARKAKKEALKKQKAGRKLQRKLARKAKKAAFVAKLKAWFKKPLIGVVSATVSVVHAAHQCTSKIQNLFASKHKQPQMHIYTPQKKKQNFFTKLWRKVRSKPQKTVVENISLNIENYKQQKTQAKKAKIIEFKQKVRERSKSTLKYAAIGLPLVGLSYMGYKGSQNLEPAFDFHRISMAWDSFSISPEVLDKANTYYTEVNDFFGVQTQDFDNLSPALSWMDFSIAPEKPINEADYDVQTPLIKNDRLHNVPNADFFNLCFEKTNAKYLKDFNYGINRSVYSDFMRENRALANFYNIGNFQDLSFDEARIIAKAQFFDKYGIAHIQNESMAAYLYYTLVKQQDKNCSVALVASAISDFYELKGIQLSPSQQKALDQIGSGAALKPDDWRELIAAVNIASSNQDTENMLFSAIQQSQFRTAIPFNYLFESEGFSQQVAVNANFTYEPTLDVFTTQTQADDDLFFADSPFLPDIQKSLSDDVSEPDILNAQKQKDLEIFCKIYAQCSYDNVIRLSYGDKRKAFADANKALAKQGIFGRIDQRLYCAGMSMASLCQAYEIFKQENPNSFVADAIGDIIGKCRIYAHSTTGMRDIFEKYSHHITYSKNLERDIKDHMKNHPYSIVQSGFRRNAAGNQHYNGFFPSMNASSKDAYTYCAYNNNHWGNEKTFSSVLRDRRRAHYGKGGWFVDVTAWIDDLADTKINNALKQREIEKQIIKPVSLSALSEKYFGSISDILNQKLSGR